MKILWLSHVVPYPPKRGVLLRAHNLVKELARHHDVDLIAINQKSLIEPYFESFEKGTEEAYRVLSGICGRVDFVDCPIDRHPYAKFVAALKGSLPGTHPYTVGWLQSDEYQKIVDQYLANSDYDVIHCDTISLATYLPETMSAKLTLDHHNIESDMLLRRADVEENWLKKIYFRREGRKLQQFEAKVCHRFDLNIVCSELDAKRLKSICPGAATYVAPNSVDTEFFKPASSNEREESLVFIGTLSWYPNVSAIRYFADEIWPKLRSQYPNLSAHIIGANPPDDLLAMADKDSRFRVMGFVDDIGPYLDQAKAYICPIFDGGGTKLKLLDAFASGKAVVAHPIACEGLSVEDGEQALLASTPDEFVEKISLLLESEETRVRLEQNARQHAVDRFSARSVGLALSERLIALTTEKEHSL